MRLSKVAICYFMLSGCLRAQTTIHVPVDQPTIQSGINAAKDGDTVLVGPGTYRETINFNGKAITVTSSDGAAATIIDGGATPGSAVVTFVSKESRSSVLSNFTIQNGGDKTFSGYASGGIFVGQAAPSILNNTIINNACNNVEIRGSQTLLQGNTIGATNTASYSDYCSFRGVGLWLGGIGSSDPSQHLDVIGNIIEKSGGIEMWSADGAVLRNNIIRNNVGEEGGVNVANSYSFVFIQNLVYGNSAGGVSQSPQGAAGLTVLIPSGAPVDRYYGLIANNVFYNNSATSVEYAATQVYFDGDVSKLHFANNIVYGGSSSLPSVVCIGSYSYLAPTPMELDDNDVFNPSGAAYGSGCDNQVGNNISLDPGFKDAGAGDFHLTSGSQAIDAGDNSALTLLSSYNITVPTDFDGHPRALNATGKPCAIVDMGAFEYAGAQADCATLTLQSSLNPSIDGQSILLTAQLTSSQGVPTGTVQFTDGSVVLGTAAISGTGAALITLNALSIGSHTIAAVYQPTGSFNTAMTTLTQTVDGYPSTTTPTCSPATISIFSTASLSAMVSSSYGTPTGSVQFTDNGALLALAALNNGLATHTYTAQTIGSHVITASYLPSNAFGSSSGSCSETVTALPSLSVLAVAPTAAVFGSPVALAAKVSPANPPGYGTPTGTVSFLSGSAVIATATLTSGVASVTTTTLNAGTDTLSCNYSGDSTYAPSACNSIPITITAAPTTLSLTSNLNPAPALTPVIFTVHLTSNGGPPPAGQLITLIVGTGTPIILLTDLAGVASYTANALLPGTYPITATFAAAQNYIGSNSSLTQVVTVNSTDTALTSSPNPGYQGQVITLHVTITSSTSASPAGTVTVFDGTNPVGTQTLDATGRASITTSTLTIGTHALTAVYNPTPYFTASTSPVDLEVILPSTFNLALSPSTISLLPNQTGSVTLQLTSVGNFSGPLDLTYGTLPTYASASINPASVTLGIGGSGRSTLTLITGTRAANAAPTRPSSHVSPLVFAAVGLLLLPICGTRRRRFSRLIVLTLAAIPLGGLTACTNSYFNVVVPGTYQLPVTATDINHNTKTATLTIIVSQ